MSASAYSPEEPNRRALYTFGSAHFLNDLVTAGLVPALVVMYKGALHLNYIHSTLIVFVSYLTSSISQPLFRLAADRTPRVWLLSVGVLLSIGGLSLTAIAGSLPWLLVFIGLSGLGSGIFHPEASRGTQFVGSGALGTLIGGTLSDKLGRKRLVVASMVVASMVVATPFAIMFSHLSGSLRVMDLLLFGFSVLSSFSVTVVYMQRLLPNNVALASGLSIGFSIGAGGIGSLFLSGLSDALGVAAVFTVLSFLPLAGGILALFLPNL